MKTRLAAAALAIGLGLAVLAPLSAEAAGPGAATQSIASDQGAPLTEQVHYRGRWRHGGWGPGFYFATPGYYGYYGNYGGYYGRPYYRSYAYSPYYYRPHYYRHHHHHYRRW